MRRTAKVRSMGEIERERKGGGGDRGGCCTLSRGWSPGACALEYTRIYSSCTCDTMRARLDFGAEQRCSPRGSAAVEAGPRSDAFVADIRGPGCSGVGAEARGHVAAILTTRGGKRATDSCRGRGTCVSVSVSALETSGAASGSRVLDKYS